MAEHFLIQVAQEVAQKVGCTGLLTIVGQRCPPVNQEVVETALQAMMAFSDYRADVMELTPKTVAAVIVKCAEKQDQRCQLAVPPNLRNPMASTLLRQIMINLMLNSFSVACNGILYPEAFVVAARILDNALQNLSESVSEKQNVKSAMDDYMKIGFSKN